MKTKYQQNLLAVALFGGLLLLAAGCASTKPVQQTETMLRQAGFKPVAASSERQIQHLQSLPADKLTVLKLKGKTFYVFPDPRTTRFMSAA